MQFVVWPVKTMRRVHQIEKTNRHSKGIWRTRIKKLQPMQLHSKSTMTAVDEIQSMQSHSRSLDSMQFIVWEPVILHSETPERTAPGDAGRNIIFIFFNFIIMTSGGHMSTQIQIPYPKADITSYPPISC